MEIKNSLNSPSFGIKIKTESVFETTTQKIFYNTGTDGFKEVYLALGSNKFPGHLGYAKQTEPIAEKIMKKYPEIAKVTAQIKEIIKNNPNLSKTELAQQIAPLIKGFGDKIDITI
jgi:hypothetical protein